MIAKAIREAILNGELATGAPLVERELAASLGVSKTPVREALWSLLQSGLVLQSPQKGGRFEQSTLPSSLMCI